MPHEPHTSDRCDEACSCCDLCYTLYGDEVCNFLCEHRHEQNPDADWDAFEAIERSAEARTQRIMRERLRVGSDL